jgi:hypothetical protein
MTVVLVHGVPTSAAIWDEMPLGIGPCAGDVVKWVV